MNFKINKWSRYVCVSIILLLIIPLCERDRTISGAVDRNIFEGQELVCAIDLGDDMLSSKGLETGLSYELMKRFAQDNKCQYFRQWLQDNNADITDIDGGEFKESGTSVATSLIHIVRKMKVGEQMSLF